LHHFKKSGGNPPAKAVLDFSGSAILLLFFGPILALISIIIFATMGRPILFRQLRTGLNGRRFHVLKFRTMIDQEHTSEPAKDDDRITPLGRFLRFTSFDELPQLFNVLKGEMSLVGPRPQVIAFENYYSPHQFRRHEVKPGITGWAQINGRNSINWERKFDLDVWYVDNWSMWLDLRILLLTPIRSLSFEDVVGPYRCSNRSFEPDAMSSIADPSANREFKTSLTSDRQVGG
jgi:lipopolysaccharide/colanic/teichoic acid biosynthesis glycosyltransferase